MPWRCYGTRGINNSALNVCYPKFTNVCLKFRNKRVYKRLKKFYWNVYYICLCQWNEWITVCIRNDQKSPNDVQYVVSSALSVFYLL